tara:strand:+ start:2844 stop:3293 length:450 start_codon:yes stop_codon:yes gene_type:complete
MKTSFSNQPHHPSNIELSSGVTRLLAANRKLANQLQPSDPRNDQARDRLETVKASLSPLLKTLNDDLAHFSGLAAIQQPGTKLHLRSIITRGEQAIVRQTRILREETAFRPLIACVDDLTELYLDFASALGSALDPQIPAQDPNTRNAA